MKNEFTGNGPFLHNEPRDRSVTIYGGKTTIHIGHGRENFLLLPIIPPRKPKVANPKKKTMQKSAPRKTAAKTKKKAKR